MQKVQISTKESAQVVDITSQVQQVLPDQGSGVCHLFLTHTSAALSTADLDPGTDQDMLDAWYEMIPDLEYRHPHDPDHVPDHILSTLIGPSESVPLENGELILGRWQRIVLCEFNGPRDRSIVVNHTAT